MIDHITDILDFLFFKLREHGEGKNLSGTCLTVYQVIAADVL
jgi:hypothetical protein